jgi:hypothetical protein
MRHTFATLMIDCRDDGKAFMENVYRASDKEEIENNKQVDTVTG